MPTAPAVPPARARAYVLRKQGLAGEGLATVMDTVTATAGVYATAPTCYLSCAARVRGFRLADLDEELYAKRRVVRLRCMRGGMAYVEPLDLVPVLLACTGEPPERTLRRVAKHSGLTEQGVLALADRVEEVLAGRPPMTLREVREALGGAAPDGQALQMVVGLLGRSGRIVRAEVRGSWRSDSYAYARWADWLGNLPEPVDPPVARAELARRYLRAYGPATAGDLAWWTGWSTRDTAAALAALGEEAAGVSLDGAAAWVLASELDALLATDPEAGRGVRLLPVWDAYFMGYAASPAARARQVAAGDYGRVYDKAGNATSTVAVDGTAAGVWQLDADAGTVTVAPFGGALAGRWEEVQVQVERLAAAIGMGLRLERAPEPGPLAGGPRNAFLSPVTLGRAAGSG